MRKKIFYSVIFLLFLIIFFLSPISGDDWGNYLEGSKGIRYILGQTLGMYFSWEGRIVSRLLINLLTYHKIIWNIVNAFLITYMIYLIIKIVKPKHIKTISLLSLLIVLLMNIFTFSQVVVWIAGNITYLFVIPIILSYFYYLLDCNKKNKLLTILFIILNFIIPMFIEHIAVILVFSNLLILIYRYLGTKKIDKELLLYLIISLISTSIVLLSPGTKIRSNMENVDFLKLSFVGKIIYNIPNFINYTFIVNSFSVLLIVIANYYLITSHIKNKWCKYLLLIINIIPIISTVNYLFNSLHISNFNLFINCNNIVIIIYYLLYMFITCYLIVVHTYKYKNLKVLFFFIIGILSNVVMMISPTWGYRTSFATYIFLSVAMLMIIDKYINENKICNYILLSICSFSSICYLILYISVHNQYIYNLKLINKCKRSHCKNLEIIRYPYYVNCNINPENSYHLSKFKKYYNLNDNVNIILKENNWRYFIFYNK